MSYPYSDELEPQPRPRRWPLVAVVVLVLLVVGGWSAIWFYAASRADNEIARLRDREAAKGRIFTCSQQSIGGYPFRIEVRCNDPAAELRELHPPLAVSAADFLTVVQIYQPTLAIAEASGPLRIGEAGQPPKLVANWKLAQASIHGLPSPDRSSVAIDEPTLAHGGSAPSPLIAKAKHMELHGRIAGSSTQDIPAFDLVLRLKAATAPGVHPLLVPDFDADVTGVLRGVKDFEPKPLPVRLREWQAAGGKIEITHARLQQGDTIAVASGTLGLDPQGRLDGELRVTVAGLEKVLPALGIDKLVQSSAQVDRLTSALDRFAPGLGAVAKQHAGAGLAAGMLVLGEPTELEGRRAVSLPLRFANGAAFLGRVPLGALPPLF